MKIILLIAYSFVSLKLLQITALDFFILVIGYFLTF